jgi:hypothetical protein
MLGSITPLGERGRGTRWWRTVTFFVIGSTFGGAMAGGLAAAIGGSVVPGLSTNARLGVLAVAVVLGTAMDLGIAGVRLPTVRRQVNEDWLARYRGWVYGLGFGVQLGLGVVTIVTSSTTYVAVLAAALSGSVMAGVLIGATFGFVRAAAVFAVAGVRRPEQLPAVDRALRAGDRVSRRIAIAAQGVAAAVLAVGAMR